MTKKFILSIVIFVAGLSQLKAQTSLFGAIVSDGIVRDYKIYVPAIYDGTMPVPLVFNFHGYGSNYIEQEQYADFRAIADTANFIVVHPNGTVDSFNTLSWNTFGNSTSNDVGFIANLIDSLRLTYNIDTTAIYSTGMSNGGFMSYELACQLSNRIAAVASVTGSITTSYLAACNTQHTMPVMQIHGTADGTVPYAGNFLFEPIDSVISHWVQFNHCDTSAVFNPVPNIDTTDNCTAVHYVYPNGDNGVEVEFYKIIGGEHSWPGAPINLNTTNMDFQANQEIWRFFRKYRLGGNIVTSNKNIIAHQNSFDVFPNPSNGEVTIKFINTELRSITVTNSIGQSIISVMDNAQIIRLNIEQKGLYLITIKDSFGTTTKKIIKA